MMLVTKLAFSVIIVAGSTQVAFAQSSMDRYLDRQTVNAIIFENEETGDRCIVNQSKLDLEKLLGIQVCRANQVQEIQEIDKATKNPEISGVLGAAANLALGYYALCSAVQSAPYLMQKYIDYNDHRTRSEQIRDVFVPSEEVRKNEARLKALNDFAEDSNQTVCRPISNLNKKLIYLFSDTTQN